MPTRNLLIVNRLGLHARAAAKFVERAQTFEATIELGNSESPTTATRWVDGKSIMSVMLLAAGKGCEIQVRAEGSDALKALDAIDELVAERFGEPD